MPEPRSNSSLTPLPSLAYKEGLTHKIVAIGTDSGDGTTTAKVAVFGNGSGNLWGCGIRVFINISVHNGGSVTVTIKGKTPDGILYTLLASAALVGSNQAKELLVFPGAAVSGNTSANNFLPKDWEVDVEVSTAAVTLSCTVDILR